MIQLELYQSKIPHIIKEEHINSLYVYSGFRNFIANSLPLKYGPQG